MPPGARLIYRHDAAISTGESGSRHDTHAGGASFAMTYSRRWRDYIRSACTLSIMTTRFKKADAAPSRRRLAVSALDDDAHLFLSPNGRSQMMGYYFVAAIFRVDAGYDYENITPAMPLAAARIGSGRKAGAAACAVRRRRPNGVIFSGRATPRRPRLAVADDDVFRRAPLRFSARYCRR